MDRQIYKWVMSGFPDGRSCSPMVDHASFDHHHRSAMLVSTATIGRPHQFRPVSSLGHASLEWFPLH